MSESVTQELGFDASSALASLAQIDGALTRFEANLQSSAAAMRQFNAAGGSTTSLLSRLATNAEKASAALSSLGSTGAGRIQGFAAAYNNVGTAVNSAATAVAAGSRTIAASTASAATATSSNVGRMTTSLQLLSRITFTQAVVRALSTLRNTVKEVGGEAVDFQKQIALIQTIDNSGQSFDALAGQVRAVSDAFNLPVLEVAQGLYQTVSNQVGNTAESFRFFNEAAKLAKATGAEVTDTVDLLSAAIKSYNLSVEDTPRVSSVFFSTIDKGRVEADELANSMGRVLPISAQLGVSLEETGGALAAISVRGSNAHESITQLRAIEIALLKPTTEMKALLEEAGFSSGEAAIKALGLAGTLGLIATKAGGGSTEMGKFFQNVRGLAGATSLTIDNLKEMASDIEANTQAGRTFADSRFLIATATDAEKVTKELNKIQNALTVDLGQAFLRAGAQLSEFAGGADEVVNVIKAAPPFIEGMAVSVTSLATAFAGARLAGLKLIPVVNELLLIPAAIGAGVSIGNFLDEKAAKTAFAGVGDLIKQDQDQLAKFKEDAKSTLDEAIKADEDRIQSARNAAREITAAYNEQVTEAKTLNKSLVTGLKADANDILSAYRQLSSAIGSAIADAEKSRQAATNRIQSLQNEQASALLKSQLAGLNDAQKVFALSQQSAQLASQAARLIASASGNEGQANRGRQQADLAKQLAEQEASVAQQTGDRSLQAKAAADLSSILSGQIAAEKQLADTEQARSARLAIEKTHVDATTKALQEQFQILLANSGALDKQGKQFSEAEQAQRAANREAASNRIAQLSLSNADTKQLANLGLGAAVAKLGSQLTVQPLKLAFDADTGITRVQNRLTQAFANFKVKLGFDTSAFENLLGQTFSNPEQIFKGLDQAKTEAAGIRKQLSDSVIAEKQIAQIRGQINATLQTANASAPSAFSFGAPANTAQQLAGLKTVNDALTSISQQAKITDADLARAKQLVTDFIQAGASSGIRGNTFDLTQRGLAASVTLLGQLQKAQQSALDPTEAAAFKTQLQSIDALLSGVNANIGESLRSGSAALQSAVSPAEAIANSSATVKANYEAAAQAILRASQASPPGGGQAQGLATGGLVRYYADGGFTPRGTDTVPAMLTPGEFVVNAAATRKFYAQLVAINSGRQPIYRADGGPTNNVTFSGDIQIVESANGKNTARQFMDGVRRELRRTTGRI